MPMKRAPVTEPEAARVPPAPGWRINKILKSYSCRWIENIDVPFRDEGAQTLNVGVHQPSPADPIAGPVLEPERMSDFVGDDGAGVG